MKITKMMYGWTKWGGASHGLVKEQLDEWYCQLCGEHQVVELPAYMFPLDDGNRNFIRICSICKKNTKAVANFTMVVEERNL